MNNIIVKKDIESLGLEAGDLLFYRPKENLYERVKQDSIKQEGLEYTLKESLKYSIDYLQEYLDDKSMSEYEDVLKDKENINGGENNEVHSFYEDIINDPYGVEGTGIVDTEGPSKVSYPISISTPFEKEEDLSIENNSYDPFLIW